MRSTRARARKGTYLGEAAGLVIELDDGKKVYFAGDTCVFGDMQLIGRIYEPDIAVLPIGDHFTMGPREAAVALELLGNRAASRATTARSRSSPEHRRSCASSRRRRRSIARARRIGRSL